MLDDVDSVIKELNEYKELGGSTIVDPTNIGIGRKPEIIKKIAEETDLNIILGSGFYLEPTHPDYVKKMNEEDISQLIQEEYYDRSIGTYGTYHLIRFGSITRTPVRPGADLLGYSGFSASNYLIQPYNANLNFTTSFTIMFWVKDWAASTNLMHRGTYTRYQNCSFHLYSCLLYTSDAADE